MTKAMHLSCVVKKVCVRPQRLLWQPPVLPGEVPLQRRSVRNAGESPGAAPGRHGAQIAGTYYRPGATLMWGNPKQGAQELTS